MDGWRRKKNRRRFSLTNDAREKKTKKKKIPNNPFLVHGQSFFPKWPIWETEREREREREMERKRERSIIIRKKWFQLRFGKSACVKKKPSKLKF